MPGTASRCGRGEKFEIRNSELLTMVPGRDPDWDGISSFIPPFPVPYPNLGGTKKSMYL